MSNRHFFGKFDTKLRVSSGNRIHGRECEASNVTTELHAQYTYPFISYFYDFRQFARENINLACNWNMIEYSVFVVIPLNIHFGTYVPLLQFTIHPPPLFTFWPKGFPRYWIIGHVNSFLLVAGHARKQKLCFFFYVYLWFFPL